MRDSKTLFLMIFALALVTISFILISIWGYHFYFEKGNNDAPSATLKKNTGIAVTKSQNDSLQNYKDSIARLISSQPQSPVSDGSDTLDSTLELKLLEYKKLQQEITEIIKNKTDLKNKGNDAEKINELQKNMEELQEKNEEIIKENERLNRLLEQKQQERGNHKTNNSANTKAVHTSLPLLVSHLKFGAINASGSYEKQTMLASKATKFEGSFEINISSKNDISSEIYVKIIQPNGSTLLNASSGFAILETNVGRRSFSLVMHFDKTKGNHKRLQFSISPDVFHKGRYTMQVYHNGTMIGRTQRTLM